MRHTRIRQQWPNPATPHEAAKNLIRRDVLRGASIHEIVCGGQGFATASGPDAYGVDVRGHQVVVWEWKWRPCDLRFSLEQLVKEIKAEAMGATQLSLFGEVRP